MNKIIEIRLHGRGGQGTVTAAELIAMSAFNDGKEVQAFPNFGVERRGAPVMAYARISDEKIKTREQISKPNFLIVQDASLIKTDPAVLQGVSKDVAVLVNTESTDWPEIRSKNVYFVPATAIALEIIGKPYINTALLGAFAAVSGIISQESVEKAIREKFVSKPELIEKNVEAMKRAYKNLLSKV
jgi:pyruvate ferredoxin oxidoreductase gamma subunit